MSEGLSGITFAVTPVSQLTLYDSQLLGVILHVELAHGTSEFNRPSLMGIDTQTLLP